MRAIGRHILARSIKEREESKSGLLLTEDDNRMLRYVKAEVISVGDEISKILPNDIVYYDKAHGHLVNVNGEQLLVVRYENVVMVEGAT
jgi:co-chaperonin GroES (HSP10)